MAEWGSEGNGDWAKNSRWRRIDRCLYVYTPTGILYARVRVGGKLISRCLETKQIGVARRELKALRKSLRRKDPEAMDMELDGLVERYRRTLTGAPKTLQTKRTVMKHLLEKWPTDLPRRVTRIRQGHIKSWLAGFKFGPASYNAHLWAVRAMFALALADHIIIENPTDGIPGAKPRRPVRLTPTWEQFKAIVENVREHHLSPYRTASADLLEFMGRCGVGRAEAWHLRWGHVDFTKWSMTLYRAKTKTAYTVSVYPQARALLLRLHAEAGEHPGPRVRVFKIHNPQWALSAACSRLGYPGYKTRSLRRMFVTRALERGVGVKSASQWQGHQDGGRLILDTYSDLLDEQANRDAERLISDSRSRRVPG